MGSAEMRRCFAWTRNAGDASTGARHTVVLDRINRLQLRNTRAQLRPRAADVVALDEVDSAVAQLRQHFGAVDVLSHRALADRVSDVVDRRDDRAIDRVDTVERIDP